MSVKSISTLAELHKRLSNDRVFLMLYKGGSSESEKAKKAFFKMEGTSGNMLMADVNVVRDIHMEYGIKTVPTMLYFEKGKLKNTIKGAQSKTYYQNFIEAHFFAALASESDNPVHSVTVYTTPTCPWCTTVKNFLKKKSIRFTEINVAADQNAAKDMVSKSGQQGVPQTEIDGHMVIGFDQKRLEQLLEL
jgi:glutaredoxin-like YruB-family protein